MLMNMYIQMIINDYVKSAYFLPFDSLLLKLV